MADPIQQQVEDNTPEELANMKRLADAWRCHQALEHFPEVIAHVRGLITASDGVSEAGEVLREFSTPLRVTATDDSDETYAQLVLWVLNWADTLGVRPPATAVAWSNWKEVQGFRAGTTSVGARGLTWLQTSWLLQYHEEMTMWHGPASDVYVESINEMFANLIGRYPMKGGRRLRPRSPRECESCHGNTVEVEAFAVDEETGVAVICCLCGWMPRDRDIRNIVGWIGLEAFTL